MQNIHPSTCHSTIQSEFLSVFKEAFLLLETQMTFHFLWREYFSQNNRRKCNSLAQRQDTTQSDTTELYNFICHCIDPQRSLLQPNWSLNLPCFYFPLCLLSMPFPLPGIFGHPSSLSLSLFLFSVDIKKYIYYFYLASPGLSRSIWDLVHQPGIKPGPPAWGAQSLSHWITREIPSVDIYLSSTPWERKDMFLSDLTEATERAHTDTHSEALCKVRVGVLFVCLFVFFNCLQPPEQSQTRLGHTTNPM